MANAHFEVGGRAIEVFGPRAEQVAHLLELGGDGAAKKLADRIAIHVADGEPGEDVVALDGAQGTQVREALDQLATGQRTCPRTSRSSARR